MKINNNLQTQYTQAKKQPVQKESDGMPQDAVTLGSTEQQGEAKELKKWTFMHYAAADNNLDPYITGDVNEMENVGSDANTNIVALLDHTGTEGAKTYYITKDNDPNNLTSQVLKDHGVINTSDPKVLAQFIIDSVKAYPAEHYMLDIGDHGGGWSGAISDDSHNGWMSTPQIKEALDIAQKETGVKMDILAFDCCLMATAEVADELKNHASFLVASEESEGGAGWNYNNVLVDGKSVSVPVREKYKNILMSPEVLTGFQRSLNERINMEPKDFAMHQVDMAAKHQNDLPTMSATDLSKMDDLNKAAVVFGDKILATSTPNTTLSGIARKTQSFSGKKDFYHFAELITKDTTITDGELKKAAQGVMDSINQAVIREEHSTRYPNAHGLTVELNDVGGAWQNLDFNKDVPNWKDAMNKF